MPLPDFGKVTTGVAKTFRASGGDAGITLTSLANGNGTSAGARQSATLDLGSTWAQRWRLDTELEFATAPTANNTCNIYASFQNGNGAGLGNTTGSDAAYTGYNNDIGTAVNQLEYLGAHICVASATPTIQRCQAGTFFPKGRYLNLVFDNRSGVALGSTAANLIIRLTPLEEGVYELITGE
jgi:hypothetical protein